ncbi:MAG: membrane protein insertase YidC [Gammaproteobacteria bacterium]|nr:membrane protein insertase YidC [Gammaproteobacteria bacterium]
MDNQRLFLWLALGLVGFLIYQAWLTDYRLPPSAGQPAIAEAPETGELPLIPDAESPDPDLPALPEAPAAEKEAAAGAIQQRDSPEVRVVTDVLDVSISLAGGDLIEARLPEYPVHKDQPDQPVLLLGDEAEKYFVFRSGWRARGDAPEPTHLASYASSRTSYRLTEGDDELVVPLVWEEGGLEVRKTYTFRRGEYAIELDYRIENRGDEPWEGANYVQIVRRNLHPERSMFDVDTYSFIGPVVYDGDKYEKLDGDDLEDEPLALSATGGWIASIQHHFLAAAVPPADEAFAYSASTRDGLVTLSAIGPLHTVPAGEARSYSEELFVGPKLQKQLAATAPELELTVDYGFLTLIAQPVFWVLSKVHGFVGNWGWAIIIVTVLIKLLFYKLTKTSGMSMARMRELQPRMKNLQERYKDDRQALSRAMMELYKREKVNPVAGCLPMLVQIPFFLAFYWVLLESVEMRQAPFMLWIDDLSARDPYFILPLMMGIAMFFQQKISAAPPGDPVQAKIMQFLPVIFSVFMAFFPAGLVLYWLTNTLLSFAQQWHINRQVHAVRKV